MNELMLQEIHAQPDTIRECLPLLRAQAAQVRFPASRRARRLLIGGCGDSYLCALALTELYRRRLPDLEIRPATALELARYSQLCSDDLVILLSISGETRRTVEAQRAARSAGATCIALTCRQDSTLAKESFWTLHLPFEPLSRRTPHTRDYLLSLVGLVALLEGLSHTTIDELAQLPDLVASAIPLGEPPSRALGAQLAQAPHFYFLGGGPNLATARYAAAKFYEAGGLVAIAEDLEDFAHGLHFVVEVGEPVIIVAPDDPGISRAQEIAAGVRDLGAMAVAISDAPALFPEQQVIPVPGLSFPLSPLLTCVPAQLLCYAVATARGLQVDADRGGRLRGALYKQVQRRWHQDTTLGPEA